MEEVIVNFDYEDQLLAQAKPHVRKVFDFLFFLTEDAKEKCLISENEYKADYIDYLEQLFSHKLFYKKPPFSKDATNWWGNVNEKERFFKLNDKEFALKFNNLNYIKINNLSQLERYLSENTNQCFAKSHHGFSGRGNCKLPSQFNLAKKLLKRGELLLMPYFKIVSEFGRTFQKTNGKIHMLNAYENKVVNSIYKGSIYHPNKKIEYQNDSLITKLENYLTDDRLKDGEFFQADGFDYINTHDTVERIEVSEFNFRKTMFIFLIGIYQKMNLKINLKNNIELIITKNDNNFSTFSQLLESYKHSELLYEPTLKNNNFKNYKLIPVSPVSCPFRVDIKVY